MSRLAEYTDTKSAPGNSPVAQEPMLQGEWDGTKGFISTPAMDSQPRTWDSVIADAGFDPNDVEVVGPVQTRFWDAAVGDGRVQRMHYFRLTLARKRPVVDLEALISAAKKSKPKSAVPKTIDDEAFVVATGDWQIGKMDGDGVEGTLERFLRFTKAAMAEYRVKGKGMPMLICFTGDCIEGFVSQGGANTWRTQQTLTEQFRIVKRLMLEMVKQAAKLAPEVWVISVPGNHDEANRPILTYADSWAVESLIAVKDTLEMVGGYEHVHALIPDRDELTVTYTLANTTITVAHGHQFARGSDGWKKWWQGQQHGRQAPGDADILIAGHKHHLTVITEGTAQQAKPRTFIQVPALESESTWFRHRAGAGGEPGMLTMIISNGHYRGLEIHS